MYCLKNLNKLNNGNTYETFQAISLHVIDSA